MAADPVTVSGPLFDGRADSAVADGIRAVRADLAAEGQKLTRQAFAASIRMPTGRFDASITAISQTQTFTSQGGRKSYTMPVVVDNPSTETVVTTEQATYGPWLEGSGSRNMTTRFKGYHGFRQAAQALDQAAEQTASDTLGPYVDRCNQ